MSDDQIVKSDPPRALIVDEYSSFFGANNDTLKEKLRTTAGVPNTAYLVKDGLVFVFDKLVSLVKERQKSQPDTPLSELAPSSVADAYVTAQEAVEAWAVVPAPYEVETVYSRDPVTFERRVESMSVLHRPFNARLPGTYRDKSDVQNALAKVLVGRVQPGSGDFTYRGQPLTLCEPMDLALLPARPAVHENSKPANRVYTALENVEYESGFEPVSEAMFNQVKEAEASWRADIGRAGKHAQDHTPEAWALAPALRLEALNDPTDEVPDYGQDEFAELRTCYPELSQLCDGSLYSLFDSFQMECRYMNSWSPERDDDFLFYMLGKVVDRQNDHETAKDVGEWVASALLHGETLDAALEFGRAAGQYNQAIGKLSHRIAAAMRFLVEDTQAMDLRGKPITTMGDTFRLGRKYNAQTMVVEQKLPF